ncbi:hypothetical protein ILUMI_04997 [Ignelater luminosus]|uniref:HTH psq-type domain-containing protein n=1 Tax=Ignelater luminosus TaxID=2038154 RepID=A0A8K0DDD9_IGNLU|nr:hypothetical protein ILUMI_04997 [Ignelater luminosus]
MVRTYVIKTKQGQWTQENMRIAAEQVLAKQVTIRKAAEIYNVPYTSLQRRVTFSRSVVKNRGGQQTMDTDTEMKLANRLAYLAGRGFGINPKAGKVTESYKNLEKVMEENDLRGKPGCVHNVDDTGMPLNNQPPNIIAKKGSTDVVSMTSVERGQNVTVLACMNAAGQFIPSFVLFKGVRKRHDFKIGMPSGTEVAITEKGWVTEEAFKLWLQHFNRYRTKEKTTSWQHSHTNMGITKVAFGGLFKQAWNQAATVGNATKRFEETGIFPLNANAYQTTISLGILCIKNHIPLISALRIQSPTCSKQLANE